MAISYQSDTSPIYAGNFAALNTLVVNDVLVLGASIMNACFDSASDRADAEARYLALGKTVSVSEQAVGGWKSLDLLSNLTSILSSFSGIESTTLVVIHIGGNDISTYGPYPGGASNLDVNLRSICEQVKSEGFLLALSTVTYRIPPASNPSDPYNTNVVNNIISEFSDIPLDLYTLTFDEQATWYSGDGIHPSTAGENTTRQYIAEQTVKYMVLD